MKLEGLGDPSGIDEHVKSVHKIQAQSSDERKAMRRRRRRVAVCVIRSEKWQNCAALEF